MTPTAAPNPSTHANAAHAGSQASRPRNSQGTQGGQGASPFAQLLQGMADEGVEPSTPSQAPTDESTADATEQSVEHGKAHEARRERDPAEDATPQATPEPTTADLATAHQASTLAAVRAKAAGGVDAARAHRATPGLDAGTDDKTRGNAIASLAHAGARDAQAATSTGLDLTGWQPTLDATPVNLTPAEPAATTSATPDFSLPSLGATAPAAAAPAEASATAQAALAPPPGSAAFGAALGAQLNTWLKDGVQYATLELNPQDMGPIDVRIALRDGHTEIQLGADVAATRTALSDALPDLADALGDVGLTLTGGSVSDQTGQHARQGEGQAQRGFTLPSWLAPARDGDTAVSADGGARRPAQRGLVDLVA